jgi:methyl-accepting chemotaxis protein
MGLFTRAERSYPNGTIRVSDEGLRARLGFIGLNEVDLGVVQAWGEVCRNALPAVTKAFYAAVTGTAATRRVLEKHTTAAKQRPVMARYLATLFDGRIDDAWIQLRLHVGKRHDQIDLDCMFYFGGYERVRAGFAAAVKEGGATPNELARFCDALGRLLFADAAITLNALMESRAVKLARSERLERERFGLFIAAVKQTVGEMAGGDLTARIASSDDANFEQVASLFNGAIRDIGSAMAQVTEAAAQIAKASHEVTAGSQSSAQDTSKQATTLATISGSLEEITGASRLTASNASEGRKRVERAVDDATEGLSAMTSLADTIGRIKESSDQTARIVKTIDEIAFQTNLLALNAAVEAARAGDAGRGFAVVAEEVRSLAIRSAEAAKTTSRMISDAQLSADAGVSAEKEVSSKLTAICAGVQSVRELIEAISQAATSQTRSVEAILTSVGDIASSSQHAASAAEQSASAAEELSGQAAALRETVARFRVPRSGNKLLQLKHHPSQQARVA